MKVQTKTMNAPVYVHDGRGSHICPKERHSDVCDLYVERKLPSKGEREPNSVAQYVKTVPPNMVEIEHRGSGWNDDGRLRQQSQMV